MIEAKIIDDHGRPWQYLPRCKDDICERNARYEVNGQPYCKMHAGEVLLSLALGIPRKDLK